jgi:hypothetical protein
MVRIHRSQQSAARRLLRTVELNSGVKIAPKLISSEAKQRDFRCCIVFEPERFACRVGLAQVSAAGYRSSFRAHSLKMCTEINRLRRLERR